MPLAPPSSRPFSAYQLSLSARGLLGESHIQNGSGATSALTSGRMVLFAIGASAGQIISRVCIVNGVGGSGQTLVKVALYSPAGALLASSADVKAAFTGTGFIASSLTVPYGMPADGVVLAGILSVGGTQPQPLYGTTNGNAILGQAGYVAPYYYQNGLADLPDPATLVNNTSGGPQIWVGIG